MRMMSVLGTSVILRLVCRMATTPCRVARFVHRLMGGGLLAAEEVLVVCEVEIARYGGEQGVAEEDGLFGLELAVGVVIEDRYGVELELVGGTGAHLDASEGLVELNLGDGSVEAVENAEHGADDQHPAPLSQRDQRL